MSLHKIAFIGLLILFISCTFSSSVIAQATAPTPVNDTLGHRNDAGQDTLNFFDFFKYRFNGDGTFSRGNVNRNLMVLRGELNYIDSVINVSSNPRFAYGQQNGIQAERDFYMDLFVDHAKRKKLYGFGLGTIETSHLRGITFRYMAGAGLGYRFVDTPSNSLSATNAIIHEMTNFDARPTVATLRSSLRLKGKHVIIKDRLKLNHTSFFQPAINGTNNIRWSTSISLEMPLTQWLSFRSTFENYYESVVEPGRKNNDTRLTFGFSVGNKH